VITQATPDMFWLLLTVIMTALLFTPYIVRLLIQHTPWRVIRDSESLLVNEAAWSLRAKRAHYNAVENLVILVPLVLMVQMTGLASPLTAAATEIYFFARLGHFIVYSAGVPFVRTTLFFVGFFAQAALVARLLGWT
jgi:uncharacterized MAPEG superfamily protein